MLLVQEQNLGSLKYVWIVSSEWRRSRSDTKHSREEARSFKEIGCSCSVVQLCFWWAGLSLRHARQWYMKDSGASIFPALYSYREERPLPPSIWAGYQKAARGYLTYTVIHAWHPGGWELSNFLTFNLWPSHRRSPKLSVNSVALPDFLLRSQQITLKGHRRSSCSSSVDVIKVNKYTRGALRWRWLSWGSCFAFQLCTFTYWETAFNLHCLFIAFQVSN